MEDKGANSVSWMMEFPKTICIENWQTSLSFFLTAVKEYGFVLAK